MIEVRVAGAETTVQDVPGRIGYWPVGVPPSGPMDPLSFRLANRAVGNPESAPGLECTAVGSELITARHRPEAQVGSKPGRKCRGPLARAVADQC